MEYQTTINTPFTLSGPGLHTGKFTHTTIRPAAAGQGIIIRRVDVDGEPEIKAVAENVVDTNHGTTVAKSHVSVSTIEHMMSALHGMRVDNAIIDVDGPEVPILDGSARLWVEQIAQSGITTLDAERKYLKIADTVMWTDSESGIIMKAEPAEDFKIDCNIEFKSNLIGSQSATLTSYEQFEKEFACCRTFVFLHEVEVLLSLNLIKGGDLDNALVFVDKPLGDDEKERLAKLFNKKKNSLNVKNGVLNTIVPYYPNEPARHKLLDFMGDIYLVGMPLKGHFTLKCPGHRANVALAQQIRKLITNY
ncbi:MAG: UDP-3-O-acyl-N-acetylglucosamine deacetylase [Bacteroidales bacterium]|nr:UDP-3-O-acyl-N-acetylglucosamine deacetylase [Bacteroidales bacterium]